MEFIAFDVETANADPGSICQIGMAYFREGELIKTWGRKLNPGCEFDSGNVSIHGITARSVEQAPRLENALPHVLKFLHERHVAAHTLFDRNAIASAAAANGLQPPSCIWLDTARVARTTWKDVSKAGFGLSNLCRRLQIEFNHHDAVEDAAACGKVLVAASLASNTSIEDWFEQHGLRGGDEVVAAPRKNATRPVWLAKKSVKVVADENGVLFGERIVFTGELSIDRQSAAAMAAKAGCRVTGAVSRKTTIVVVGQHDPKTIKADKSGKHLKAEELAAQGHPIRILGEEEFLALIDKA